MQNWTSDMWLPAIVGLVVGFVLCYLLLRLTKGSIKKQVKTETELKKLQTQLAEKNTQLEQHFSQSAELLKKMAEDYQALYQHLAQSSLALVPQTEENKIFENPLISDNSQEVITDSEHQPRDYSEGSSGIFKAEK